MSTEDNIQLFIDVRYKFVMKQFVLSFIAFGQLFLQTGDAVIPSQ